MALRGNLRDFSLPDVFSLVTLSKKTGVLRIRRADAAEGSVWFRDGEVFFAQSNWHREPLGQRLVDAAKITPAALARTLEAQRSEPEGGRRLGQILIDEGFITPAVLEAFVQEQIQDTIFDLMRWDEGDFDFEPLETVDQEDIGLTVSIENIIMEGSRRLEEWNRIKKKVPSMDMVFKMATAPGEGTFEISLKPIEWNLLLLVDGTRSVAELAQDTNRTDFDVARIVYGLFAAGLLEVASEDEVERLRAERAEREAKNAAADQARAKKRAEKAERAAREAAEAAQAAAAADAAARAAAEAEAAARAAAEAEAQAAERAKADAAARAEADAAAAAEADAAARAAAEAASALAGQEAPAEEPEFLSASKSTPSADDMAVFEQMMGAVLDTPIAPAPEPEPVIEPAPEPEPAIEPIAEPELAIEPVSEPVVVPVLDIEPVAEPEAEIPSIPESLDVPEAAVPTPAADDLGLPIWESALFEQPAPTAEPAVEPEPLVSLAVEASEAIHAPEWEQEPELGVVEPMSERGAAPVESPASEEVSAELVDYGYGAPLGEDLLAPLGGPQEADVFAPTAEEPFAAVPQPEVETYSIPVEVPQAQSELPEEPHLEPSVTPLAEEAASPALTELLAALEQEEPSEPAPEEPAAEPSAADLERSVLEEFSFEPEAPVLSEIEAPADIEPLSSPEPETAPVGLISSEPASWEDEGAEEATSVISTDAFLAEFDAPMDMGLSSGIGDELTALTGGGTNGRGRPVASVNRIPEADSSGKSLHRDQAVDRALVLKIIEGIDKL